MHVCGSKSWNVALTPKADFCTMHLWMKHKFPGLWSALHGLLADISLVTALLVWKRRKDQLEVFERLAGNHVSPLTSWKQDSGSPLNGSPTFVDCLFRRNQHVQQAWRMVHRQRLHYGTDRLNEYWACLLNEAERIYDIAHQKCLSVAGEVLFIFLCWKKWRFTLWADLEFLKLIWFLA